MHGPASFLSLLAAASVAFALPSSGSGALVAERQAAPVSVVVSSDTGDKPVSFEPFALPAERRALAVRQAAPVSVVVSSDTGDKPVSFEPFALPAERRAIVKRNAFGTILGGVRDLIIALNAEDLEKRERLTTETAARLANEFPGNTIVVTNVGFTFTEGDILEQGTISFDAKIGATVTFEVLRFNKGKFVLEGDGGFINWAYVAQSGCVADGKTITCQGV